MCLFLVAYSVDDLIINYSFHVKFKNIFCGISVILKTSFLGLVFYLLFTAWLPEKRKNENLLINAININNEILMWGS